MSGVLSREDIRRALEHVPPLIEGYLDLATQLQPNGFDVTMRDIALPDTPGQIALSNEKRVLSRLVPLAFESDGFVRLDPGPYVITFGEVVHLPNNVMALARPRSSLLRCGVTVENAVWDAGYEGRSQALLVVHNPAGFRLEKNARVAQLVFFYLSSATSEGYNGKYQGENL